MVVVGIGTLCSPSSSLCFFAINLSHTPGTLFLILSNKTAPYKTPEPLSLSHCV
uniref:Uncharacterized protein n=1 Tax=Amphimedon queenslandica TaxID=400682 RepID=A0A1X7VG00_AMPQE